MAATSSVSEHCGAFKCNRSYIGIPNVTLEVVPPKMEEKYLEKIYLSPIPNREVVP